MHTMLIIMVTHSSDQGSPRSCYVVSMAEQLLYQRHGHALGTGLYGWRQLLSQRSKHSELH